MGVEAIRRARRASAEERGETPGIRKGATAECGCQEPCRGGGGTTERGGTATDHHCPEPGKAGQGGERRTRKRGAADTGGSNPESSRGHNQQGKNKTGRGGAVAAGAGLYPGRRSQAK